MQRFRKKKERFAEEYRCESLPNGKKKYVYIGPTYALELSFRERQRFIALAFGAPALSLCLLVLGGLQNTAYARLPYIMLPFIALFMPLCILLGDAYKFAVNHGPMKRAEYERCAVQMRRATVAALCLSGVSALGILFTGVFRRLQMTGGDAVLLLSSVGIAVISILFHEFQKMMHWVRQ